MRKIEQRALLEGGNGVAQGEMLVNTAKNGATTILCLSGKRGDRQDRRVRGKLVGKRVWEAKGQGGERRGRGGGGKEE